MRAFRWYPPDREARPRVRRGLGRRLGAFRRDQDGAAAVEFAIVAVPFFALLLAILETAVVLLTSQALETAVADAARTIYTGRFQANNATGDIGRAFKREVCSRVVALFACTETTATVHVDVRLPAGGIPPAILDGAVNPAAFGYQATRANDLVLVRVAVEYPVFATLLNPNQANLANGKRLIMGSATFRNEPF